MASFNKISEMSLPTLILISFMMLIHVGGTQKLRHCDDCVPYTQCKEAKRRAESDRSNASIKMFREAFCGLNEFHIPEVCCSHFETPKVSFESRLNELVPEPEHQNIGLLPDSCGIIAQDRIIGGVDAGLYEFPWMVLIAYPYKNGHSFECSGTLINPRYVLTAAHCVVNREIVGVRIGEYNIKTSTDCIGNVCESHLEDKQVEKAIVHKEYEGARNYKNDIALLRLKGPIDLSFKNAGTICLPTTKKLQEDSVTHQRAIVAGWGLTELGRDSDVLRKVIVPIHANEACMDDYGEESGPDVNQFCAGEHMKDSCRGDSGGPLMLEKNYKDHFKTVQYGIVSNGPNRCGKSHAPGIYTDVRKYVNWILDNMES